MSYLIRSDFKKMIQTDNLAAILGNDYTLLDDVIRSSQTEIISYLAQKYDTTREFSDIDLWLQNETYKALNRVYLDAPAFNQVNVYDVDEWVSHAGSVWVCTLITIANAPFDVGHWQALGIQYQKYYVTLPYPEFSYDAVYKKGDHVWWKDKTYTCAISTTVISHEGAINYPNYKSLPPINIAPDDTISGKKYWGTGVAYSVTAGTRPLITNKWTAADNRNAQLVNCMIDVSLYTIHSRIAPRNIPELRVKRYDDAIKWLRDCAKGQYITAALPLIKPSQGARIRFGSDVRKNTQY